MNLARNWYFVQVGPLDPRAKTLPLPDDLMGRLIEYVAAHEVGPHARVPAQHEGQLDVLGGQSARSRVGEEDGPHADPHGLLALQLRRAARGQHRRRRPRPGHRALRQVGHDVGLQADSRRPHARRREEDARRVGSRSRTTTPYLRFSTAGSAGSDPGELTEAVGDEDAVASTTLGLKNLKRVADMLLDRHDDEDRRALRRPRRSLRTHARTVVHRDEPRRGDRRRLQLAAEEHRAAGRALQADAARETGDGRPVPERQRVSDADLGDQPGDPAADRAGRRARPDAHRSAAGPQLAAEQPANRPAG